MHYLLVVLLFGLTQYAAAAESDPSLPLLASPAMASIERLCRAHTALLEQGQSQRLAIDELIRIASRSDLVFIAETHMEHDRTSHYRTLLSGLVHQDKRFNCCRTSASSA